MGEDLYLACTKTDEYRGPHFSTGAREWSDAFASAEDKAIHAIKKEIEVEVGEEISWIDDLPKYISPKDLAQRVVDYILAEKPDKPLARKLAKLGY